MDFASARGEAGDVGSEQLQAASGEEKTEGAAEKSEEGALGEELAEEADAIGAHGGAHAEFAFAADHAREVEVGNIGAGDEENEASGGEKEEHGGFGVAGELGFQRRDVDLEVGAFGVI